MCSGPDMPPKRSTRLAIRCIVLLEVLSGCRGQIARFEDMQADTVSIQAPPTTGPTGCADGSAFKFIVRKGTTNANRVLVDFMGGGACWGDRCLEDSSIQVQSLTGIFSFVSLLDGKTTASARSLLSTLAPLGFQADIGSGTDFDVSTWTYIFVPYCTQDIHLGNCDVTYTGASGQQRRVRHNGAANVKSVMDWVYESFAAPESIAFVGCSAGASAVIVTEAARASIQYASANTVVVAVGDSPSNLLTEKFVHEGLVNWGVGPVLEDVTGWSNATEHLSENLLSEAMAAVFSRHPSVQFAFYTRTADETQLLQYQTMGGMVDDLGQNAAMEVWNRQNLAMLEGLQSSPAYTNFRTFVAEGAGHCAMTFDSALTNDGFKEWVEALLLRGTSNGPSTTSSDPDAENCGPQCTLAGVVGCDGIVGSEKLEDRCVVCGGDGSTCSERTSWTPLDACPPTLPIDGAIKLTSNAGRPSFWEELSIGCRKLPTLSTVAATLVVGVALGGV